MKSKDLGNLFKEKLLEHQVPPSENFWEHLKNDQQVVSFRRKQLLKRISYYVSGAIVGSAVVAAVVLSLSNQPDPIISPATPSISSSPIISSIDTTHKINNQIIAEGDPKTTDIQLTHPEQNSTPSPATPENFPQSTIVHATTIKDNNSQLVNTTSTQTSTPQTADTISSINNNIPSTSTTQNKSTLPTTSQASPTTEDFVFSDSHPQDLQDNQENLGLQLHIPKAFTPNGDGLNDLFFAIASEEVTHFEMSIFDANGAIITTINNIHIGWDGKVNGQVLSNGAYLYVIRCRDKAGKQIIEKGQFILIR